MNRFRITARARFDIEDTLDYLMRHSPPAALRWEDELYGVLHRLAAHPFSAPLRSEFAPEPVRVQVMGDYLVFYDPSHDPIVVLRVLRASRDLSHLFFSSEVL